MSYVETAVQACKDIKDRTGVSLPQMKAYFAQNKPDYKPHALLKALKAGVASGKLAMHHTKKGSYKVGATAAAKRTRKPAAKKAAPKRKPAKKKKTKKRAPKKKATKKKKKSKK